jgi:AcrR family transcriptional regulator
MSPSAVFNATIDAITSVTPMHATTIVQIRARFEPRTAVASVRWSDRTRVSTIAMRLLSATSKFETNSLVHRRTVLLLNAEVVYITDKTDPRPARSRARLLEAATALLRSGGPSAVTVDAVTRAANVARATLYRHFPSGNDLLAAAFNSLIPPAPMPSEDGSLRDRLITLVVAWGQSIAEAPGMVTAMSWLALGPDLEQLPEARQGRTADSPAVSTLRERIAQQYAAPFDAVFDSPEAAELGDIDRTRAIALLIGPVVLGRLSTLPDFNYRECARAAVDGFLHVQRTQDTSLNAARSESAGA